MKNNRAGALSAQNAAVQTIKQLAIGLVATLCCAVVLFCVFAAIISKLNIPMAAIAPIATALIAGAVFVGSMVFARMARQRGLLYGAGLGLFVFLVLCAFSLLQGPPEYTALAAIKFVCLCAAGALGGSFGMSQAEKKRKIRHN